MLQNVYSFGAQPVKVWRALYDGDYFVAELGGLNLHARARVGAYMSGGSADLFAEMAAQWRGWEDSKSWSSLEAGAPATAAAEYAELAATVVGMFDAGARDAEVAILADRSTDAFPISPRARAHATLSPTRAPWPRQ